MTSRLTHIAFMFKLQENKESRAMHKLSYAVNVYIQSRCPSRLQLILSCITSSNRGSLYSFVEEDMD